MRSRRTLQMADWQTLLAQLQGLGLRVLSVNRQTGEVLVKVPVLEEQ